MTFVFPVLYAVFLWWLTTGMIVAVYKRSQAVMSLSFAAASAAFLVSVCGIYATRDLTGPRAIYAAITFGVVIWGWQTASYYLGYVTGPGHKSALEEDLPRTWGQSLVERSKLALQFVIHHEMVVIATGALLAALTWSHSNRWGLWIYVALWLMHLSAKINVFLGVRNFSVEYLPKRMHYIDRLLVKRPTNALFPVSIVISTSVGLALLYRGIAPGTPDAEVAGSLFVGTMIALGIIEHWMMVLPLPSTLVGFSFEPVPITAGAGISQLTPSMIGTPMAITKAPAPTLPAQPTYDTLAAERRIKRTYTFERPTGPFVVDVWEPRTPSGKAPVVLIHGWGNSGSYWKETARALSETAQVIVPDLPGTGRSLPVAPSQDMYDQVNTLAWMLDELELPTVQLVGHSMGSAMSLLLAERAPQRVERILLTSLAFFMKQSEHRIYGAVMNIHRLSFNFRPNWLASAPLVPQLMASRYFHRVPDDEQLLRQGLRDFLTLDADTAVACALNATDDDIPRAGAAVSVPVMMVMGRQDQFLPLSNAGYTANTIPGCEIHWIDACGHLPMLEQPDEYLSILNDFLGLNDIQGERS